MLKKVMLQQSNGVGVIHTVKKKENYIVTFFLNFLRAVRQKKIAWFIKQKFKKKKKTQNPKKLHSLKF